MIASICPALTIDGQWFRVLREPVGLLPRPAMFLDRDGVLIEEREYLSNPEGVTLIAGAAEALRRARENGFATIIVTNQSGIGRGYFRWGDYAAVEARMLQLLGESDASVDAILACPNHINGVPPYDRDHPWRKPNPGMVLAAAERLSIALSQSFIVGDKATDLSAGRAAGVGLGVHVATGHGTEAEWTAAQALCSDNFQVTRLAGIVDVAVSHTLWHARSQ